MKDLKHKRRGHVLPPLLALGLVLPTYLIPPIAWLTKVFPTRKMREVERAMGVLASLSDELYEDAVAELEGGVEQQSHNLLKMFIQARKRESGDLLTRDEVKAQAVSLSPPPRSPSRF